MICPRCASTQIAKNGHRYEQQAYVCKNCGRQFLESYLPKGYSDEVKQQCLTMYRNGMGFRAIERATGVGHNTVIRWAKAAAAASSQAPNPKNICATPQES